MKSLITLFLVLNMASGLYENNKDWLQGQLKQQVALRHVQHIKKPLSARLGVKPIVFEATAYEAGPRSCGYWARFHLTASGKKVRVGYIAADTRVLPFHTKVYIEGIGERIVEDRGGAIKGKRVDIYMNTVRECLKFGRKKVKVWIISKPPCKSDLYRF